MILAYLVERHCGRFIWLQHAYNGVKPMNNPRSTRKCGFGSVAFASIVRLLIFGILAVAVFGKIQNAPAILRGESLLSSWLFLKLAVAVEIFVAACILLATRTTVWITVVSLFSTFTVFATYEWLLGGGCECFGRSLPSWLSLPVDLVVLGVMVGSRRIWREDVMSIHSEASRPSARPLKRFNRRDAIAVVTGSGAALLVWGMFLPSPGAGRETGVRPDLKFLLAEDWIGEAWPINQCPNGNPSLRIDFSGTFVPRAGRGFGGLRCREFRLNPSHTFDCWWNGSGWRYPYGSRLGLLWNDR